MAWTSVVLGSTDDRDAIREVIDNHLPSLANWEIAVPSSNSDARNMRLDISGSNELAKQYLGIAFDGQYGYIVSWQDRDNASSWEEQISNYGGGGIYIDSSSSKFTYWTSNTMGDSFMIIDGGGILVWGYLEPTKLFIAGDDTWGANGPNPYTGFCGYGSRGGSPVWGAPHNSTMISSEEIVAGYYYADYGVNSSYDSLVLLGFPLFQSYSSSPTGTGSSMIGYYDTPEVLVQVGVGSVDIDLFDGGLKKVTVDGSNWWLRSNSDLGRNALLIDMGPTEPVF